MALYIISKSEGVITYDDIKQKSREEKDAYSKETIFDKVKIIFKKETFDNKEYDKVLDICLKALEPSLKRLEDRVRESFKREDFSSVEIEKLLIKYKYYEGEIWKSKIFSIEKNDIKEMVNITLENELLEAKVLRCNFLNKKNPEHSFLNLSSGEKLYLNFLTNYAYTLFKLNDYYKGLMMFDEIELSFHPSWQKKILNHILYIYRKGLKHENKKLNIHLLLSSHSPFVLSDLPKQNVIFLKDGKEVEGVQKKQTFGANIHTLLSDSFFMDDGLMGEFAKKKIDEIIKNLKDEDYDPERKEKENILLVIKSIGEPFLKNKILEMYYKKFNDVYLREARRKELLEEQAKIALELKKYD